VAVSSSPESNGPVGGPAEVARVVGQIRANMERVIEGKPDMVRLALVALLAEGHLLIEDVPGVGKTMLAKALARSIDCSVRRIQFTPDLLPSDVTGVSVYNQEQGDFEFKPGAVFANIVLGDEINRASPKTQAALLESMEEHQVTMDGVTYQLGVPFMVVATQNPVEHEGTYPLPESQRDRFLLQLSMGYPTREAEVEILETHGRSSQLAAIGPVADAPTVASMIEWCRTGVFVADSLKQYIVDMVRATRSEPDLALGASPRASLALLRAARAAAAGAGRAYVVPDDVKDLVVPVLAHRLIRAPEAEMAGRSTAGILAGVMERVPVPVGPGDGRQPERGVRARTDGGDRGRPA
jgi:MoxR-like ATPase